MCFALGIIGLAQFIISLYFHKMIGLETANTLQFVYYIRIVTVLNSSIFCSMSSMNYVNGYNGLKHNASRQFFMSKP